MKRLVLYIATFALLLTCGEAMGQAAGAEASTTRIQPADLEYKGAFRLPDGPEEIAWEWSGEGMTYYPKGDPEGPDDGYPGSIFGIGHDWNKYVSEISIPVPVISAAKNVDDLNRAEALQEFHRPVR